MSIPPIDTSQKEEEARRLREEAEQHNQEAQNRADDALNAAHDWRFFEATRKTGEAISSITESFRDDQAAHKIEKEVDRTNKAAEKIVQQEALEGLEKKPHIFCTIS